MEKKEKKKNGTKQKTKNDRFRLAKQQLCSFLHAFLYIS